MTAWLAFPAVLLVIVGGWLAWQRGNPPRAEDSAPPVAVVDAGVPAWFR